MVRILNLVNLILLASFCSLVTGFSFPQYSRSVGLTYASFSSSNRSESALTSSKKLNMFAKHPKDDIEKVSQKFIKTIGSTTSIFVSGTFFVILSYKRDSFMLTFFIGSILNGITSKILKRALNIDRPDGHLNKSSVKIKPSDKGMPSSHAMSLGFICTYTALEIFKLMGKGLTSLSIISALMIYSAISLIYRVQSKLHTTDQIVVGLSAGIFNSMMWRSLAFGINPIFPSINIMEWIQLKILPDSGVMPMHYLIVPALVGAMVVGSVERRISLWLRNRKKDE